MRLGVHLTRYDTPRGPQGLASLLAETGAAADAAGIDVLSCMDHFMQLPFLGPAEEPVLEGYTTLGFLAAHTRDVELQLLVSGVTYRYPGVLAKTVTTLDVLSGGRAVLGLGAAWYEREHLALGVPFPPLRDRFVLLEETLQAVRQMWSEDDGPFHGQYVELAETLCSPPPLRTPPIMVGGVGERKALRVVARHADACNIFADEQQFTDFVGGKLEVLREHCEAEGTSYDALRRTILWTGELDLDRPEEFLDRMAAMAAIGVQEVHVIPPRDPEVENRPHDFLSALGDRVVSPLRAL